MVKCQKNASRASSEGGRSMSLATRVNLISFALMTSMPAISLARPDTDGKIVKPDAKSQEQEAPKPASIPVTHEMRVQILERLLALAHDNEQTTDARIAAIRSVRPLADAHRPKAREGILKIALGEDVPAELRVVASGTLLRGGFNLSKAQEEEVSNGLWRILTEQKGPDDESRRIRTLAGYVQLKFGSPPADAPAVDALIAMTLDGRQVSYRYLKTIVAPDDVARELLEKLPESERGLRLLIEVLGSLEIEPADEVPLTGRAPPDPNNDDASRRERIAEDRFEEKRRRLVSLIGQASPETKGMAEILLNATTHESPTVREAAIRALGNER